MKNTKQRLLIINILNSAKNPLSANEILKRAQAKQPNIALTTIYRNIEAMHENDLIIRHRIGDKEYSYELKKEEHSHYIVCKGCKKKITISDCPIEEITKAVAEKMGFHITSHNIELEGYCKECDEKK